MECLRSRMAWSDQEVMRAIICVLATQGWEKILEDEMPLDCIDRLVERFSIPLQGAQVDVSKIKKKNLSPFCSMQSSSSLSPQWTIMLYGGTSFTHPLLLSGPMFSSCPTFFFFFFFLFLHPTESLSVFSHK